MTTPGRQKLLTLLDEALQSSTLAWWEWDIAHNRVTFNDLKVTMLGYKPEDFLGAGYQAFTDLLHPEDFERTMQAMRDHLEGRASLYQVDYRIRKADGSWTWYMDRGAILARSADGAPGMLRGLVIDLGPQLQSYSRNAALVSLVRQSLPDPRNADSILQICVVCKALRLGRHAWIHSAKELPQAFPGAVSHGFCEGCFRRLYPEDAALLDDIPSTRMDGAKPGHNPC